MGEIGNIIIFISAILLAITNIFNFFVNGGRGIKKKVDSVKEKEKIEEEAHIREVYSIICGEEKKEREQNIRDIVSQIQEEQSDIKREIICDVVEEVLPEALVAHDTNIKKELEDIASIISNLTVLTEGVKDMLREKIMAIYHKNKKVRQLEYHEKEALDQYYKDYKSIGGNSYIDKYYRRMLDWNKIPDDYDDE